MNSGWWASSGRHAVGGAGDQDGSGPRPAGVLRAPGLQEMDSRSSRCRSTTPRRRRFSARKSIGGWRMCRARSTSWTSSGAPRTSPHTSPICWPRSPRRVAAERHPRRPHGGSAGARRHPGGAGSLPDGRLPPGRAQPLKRSQMLGGVPQQPPRRPPTPARSAIRRAHSSGGRPAESGFSKQPGAFAGRVSSCSRRPPHPPSGARRAARAGIAQLMTTGSEVTAFASRAARSACSALVADSIQMPSAPASCAICRSRSRSPAQRIRRRTRAALPSESQTSFGFSRGRPGEGVGEDHLRARFDVRAVHSRTASGCSSSIRARGAQTASDQRRPHRGVQQQRPAQGLRQAPHSCTCAPGCGAFDPPPLCGQPDPLRLQRQRLAVDEEDAAGSRRAPREPALLLGPVGVRREPRHLRESSPAPAR